MFYLNFNVYFLHFAIKVLYCCLILKFLMVLNFYLRFTTHFGQTIFVSGNTDKLGYGDLSLAFPLQYLNNQLWHGSINIDSAKDIAPISYKYILREDGKEESVEFGDDRIITSDNLHIEEIVLLDTWNYSGEIENVYFTQAFQDVILKTPTTVALSISKSNKNYTHEFRVKAPILNKDELVCITGSAVALNNWSKEKPIFLKKK